MFAPVVAEVAPTTADDPDAASRSGIVLALADLRLSFGPDVPAGRVAAIVAALRAE